MKKYLAALLATVICVGLVFGGVKYHWQESVEITDDSWTILEAAPASDEYICVTSISVMNGDSAVNTDVLFYNDDDGDVGDSTLIYQGHAANSGGGWTDSIGRDKDDDRVAIFCSEAAGEAIYVVCETTSSETKVNVRGFVTNKEPQI